MKKVRTRKAMIMIFFSVRKRLTGKQELVKRIIQSRYIGTLTNFCNEALGQGGFDLEQDKNRLEFYAHCDNLNSHCNKDVHNYNKQARAFYCRSLLGAFGRRGGRGLTGIGGAVHGRQYGTPETPGRRRCTCAQPAPSITPCLSLCPGNDDLTSLHRKTTPCFETYLRMFHEYTTKLSRLVPYWP